MVITMFAGEAKPWLDNERFTQKVAIPGLSKAFPDVSCTEAGLCLMTTSMGYANAASSVSALIYSGRFNLSPPKARAQGIQDLTRWLDEGRLQHTIGASLPLGQTIEAHERVEQGTLIGNVVVKP